MTVRPPSLRPKYDDYEDYGDPLLNRGWTRAHTFFVLAMAGGFTGAVIGITLIELGF